MNRVFKSLQIIVLILISQSAFAVKEVDIYTQSVLVEKNANASNLADVRKQAMLKALQSATLINEIDRNAKIKDGLKKHKQYILSEKVKASDEVFINVIGQEKPMVELVIQFDSKKINQLLLSANVSTLDSKRPESLVVILVQHKDGSTEILSQADLFVDIDQISMDEQVDEQTQRDLALLQNNIEGELVVESAIKKQVQYESVVQLLENNANTLKLPLVWPLMDPQDMFFFDQDNFWQVDKDSILGFAKRYSVQIVLIARIKEHDDGRFIGEWNVLDLGRPKVQYYDSLEGFALAGLKQLAQTIMQQYGINPNDKKDEQVLVRMTDVSNVTDFHKNAQILGKLSGVQSVQVINVEGFKVTYLLQLGVSQKQFLNSLKLNDSLDFIIEDELRRPVVIDINLNISD